VNVGEAAQRAGLPVKTVHYYESIGLVAPARRPNGYRDYDAALVRKLAFLQRARGLGFSIDECRSLLSLYEDRTRASKDVKTIAQAKLADIERKIDALRSLQAALSHLVHACHGDERPDCPILDDLASDRGA
jgi:MerR family copper efflux transcriptional regulator